MIKFAIEQDVFNEDFSEMYRAISLNGAVYNNVVYRPFFGIHECRIDPEDTDVIFMGSLNCAKHVIRNTKWRIWCDFDKFKCSHYYTYLGEHLINKDYMMMPLKEVIRQKSSIVNALYLDEHQYNMWQKILFIRPDNGFKSFTGNIVNYVNIETEISSFIDCDSDYEQLVVVSSPKNIKQEWRFFVIDGKVITGSLYHVDGKLSTSRNTPDKVWQYAEKISKVWQPESAYVLDIGEAYGSLGVMEINSFSCSGLYQCDQNLIIENIIKLFNKEKEELSV